MGGPRTLNYPDKKACDADAKTVGDGTIAGCYCPEDSASAAGSATAAPAATLVERQVRLMARERAPVTNDLPLPPNLQARRRTALSRFQTWPRASSGPQSPVAALFRFRGWRTSAP